MRAFRTIRQLCTSQSQEQPIINFNSLAAPLRSEARKVALAFRGAREATAIATADGSDDEERREAVLKVKHALRRYSELAALCDPPVHLSEYGTPMEKADHAENNVTKLFQGDLEAMKKEIFESNRQRVWIGWRGWF